MSVPLVVRHISFLVLIYLTGVLTDKAKAQEVCYTPGYTCYMNQFGPLGGPCYCRFQNGYLNGIIGSSTELPQFPQQQFPQQQFPQFQPQFPQQQFPQQQFPQQQFPQQQFPQQQQFDVNKNAINRSANPDCASYWKGTPFQAPKGPGAPDPTC